MMNQILKNIEEDKFLKENGYIIFRILNDNQIAEFNQVYEKWHKDSPEIFYKSYFSPNETYKSEVENLVLKHFSSFAESKFINYIAFGGMFVSKPPGEDGHFPPHQDWSFVDEQKHWSLNMWCPLVNVEEKNGYLYVLPGSHDYNITIRGAHTPDTYNHLHAAILENIKGIKMEAGEAIFFYHGLVHGSTINSSDSTRVSVGLSLVEKNVPILYHFYNNEDLSTERFLVKDVSFYKDYVTNRDQRPSSIESLGIIDFDYPRLSEEELINNIRTHKSRLETN